MPIPTATPGGSRGTAYYCAFSSIKHMGAGQFYLFAARDGGGQPLDGGASYRLHVPASVPVRQYWSVTLYDFATHAFIREMDRQSCSSLSPGLMANPDGSVDVYFGPTAPEGKSSNWVPTSGAQRFEALFPLLRTWRGNSFRNMGASRHRARPEKIDLALRTAHRAHVSPANAAARHGARWAQTVPARPRPAD